MELSLQFGPILLGVLLSMIMHGVLLSQIYSYYLLYRSTDPKLNKYMVLYIFIVESLHTAFSIFMIYQPLILRFGDPHALVEYPLALSPLVSLMAAISLPIQIFVAWRIIRLQHSFWVGGAIFIFAAISFAGGVLSAVQIKQSAHFSERRSLQLSAILWLTPGAITDIVIAATLSWSLYKRKTGLPSTDAVISRIIRLTIQTGVMTSIAAVLNLLTLVALPTGNSINFIFNIMLMKIYGNFLLATLNARASWTNDLQHVNGSLLFENVLNASDKPLSFVKAISAVAPNANGETQNSESEFGSSQGSSSVDMVQRYSTDLTLPV